MESTDGNEMGKEWAEYHKVKSMSTWMHLVLLETNFMKKHHNQSQKSLKKSTYVKSNQHIHFEQTDRGKARLQNVGF